MSGRLIGNLSARFQVNSSAAMDPDVPPGNQSIITTLFKQLLEFSLDFLLEYGLSFAKIATFVIAVIILLSVAVAISQKSKQSAKKGHLEITPLNQFYDEMSDAIKYAVMDEHQQKVESKKQQKRSRRRPRSNRKALKKAAKSDTEAVEQKPRVFVVNFHGNIAATAVTNLREEVTAILSQATDQDEVVVRWRVVVAWFTAMASLPVSWTEFASARFH